jgi:hypothetical protein
MLRKLIGSSIFQFDRVFCSKFVLLKVWLSGLPRSDRPLNGANIRLTLVSGRWISFKDNDELAIGVRGGPIPGARVSPDLARVRLLIMCVCGMDGKPLGKSHITDTCSKNRAVSVICASPDDVSVLPLFWVCSL